MLLPSWLMARLKKQLKGAALVSNHQNLALYFHWPYCLAKCPYCDFNVHIAGQIDHARWRDAYLRALAHYAERYQGRRIGSVYFGGGTPSLMQPATIDAILSAAADHWGFSPDVEITLEANPTSAEIGRFHDFKAAGVNRLSLGVQSLEDEWLSFLGRKHSAAQAIEAINLAQRVFGRMSFDLIYARPDQSLDQWRGELSHALKLAQQDGGGHLSLYQLTIERNTSFYMSRARGEFTMPSDDLSADAFDLTQDLTAAAGLPAYEVSNHASLAARSAHNMVYWHYGDYLGIGPGAHGRMMDGGQRLALRDHYAPDRWLELVESQGHGAHAADILPLEEQEFEALMMGLRLYEGIDVRPFERRLDHKQISLLASEGLLCYEEGHLRLYPEGMIRLNAVLGRIIKG